MERKHRLKRASDFKRVRAEGKSLGHPLMALVFAPNGLPYSRVAVVAGRNVGKAVRRNRAKRRLRACVEQLFPYLQSGWDVVVYARPGVVEAPFSVLLEIMSHLLRRSGLWQPLSMQDHVESNHERLPE
ncbi:ribonuclease P protein component [uncultured Thermanaerothrix sp.]|uniref:ribonuclease P protein component n=1 Tax=uncultured Thermanaerothrix sp. TaxID=1195149 RepID=UPI00262E4C94|nr:ribonuclease P protein component [uncultured Thermanaerothrix sp.]